MCDKKPNSLPSSLQLLDQLRTPGSPLRSQLCVAVSTISRRIAKEQQRALAQGKETCARCSDVYRADTSFIQPRRIPNSGDPLGGFSYRIGHAFRKRSLSGFNVGTAVNARSSVQDTACMASNRQQSHGMGAIQHLHHTPPVRTTSDSNQFLQPEICSNISTAPVELYHRVLEAKQCLLHSLCVLPLWMPEVTQNAPVAVLEILQPETQPDFESLHELAGYALKDVTITKATVIQPMPELANNLTKAQPRSRGGPGLPSPAAYDEQLRGYGPSGCQSKPSTDHDGSAAEQARNGGCTHEAHASGIQPVMHVEAGTAVSEDTRMKMVFDDRAQNSDGHLQHVAEQCESATEGSVGVRKRCLCSPSEAGAATGKAEEQCACVTMPNMQTVACRIAARPSTQLNFPAPCGEHADQDGVLGRATAQHVTAPSTASVCGHEGTAAHDRASAAACNAGAGAGVPVGVAAGAHQRDRKACEMAADGDQVGADWSGSKLETTSLAANGTGSGVFEPGTPNDTSDPEEYDFMEEEVPRKATPPSDGSPPPEEVSECATRAASDQQLPQSGENVSSPVDTSPEADSYGVQPNKFVCAGSRSNSGRGKAPQAAASAITAAISAAAGSVPLSGPSSGAASVHGSGAGGNMLPPSHVHGFRGAAGVAPAVAPAAVGAAGSVPGTAAMNEMNSMIHAIELLNVVQSDTEWQAAEHTGGGLKGGPAALLSAIQSRSNEASMHKLQEQVVEDDAMDGGRPRKKRSPSALPPFSASVATGAPTDADGMPADSSALQAAQHRHFAYPGSTGATFVRVAHRPQPHSLQDKVLTAETGALAATAAADMVLPAAAHSGPPPLQGAAHALPDATLPSTAPSMHMQQPVTRSMHGHPSATAMYAQEAAEGATLPPAPVAGTSGGLWSTIEDDDMHGACAYGAEGPGSGTNSGAGGPVLQRKMPARASNTGSGCTRDHKSATPGDTSAPVATDTCGGSDAIGMPPSDLRALRNRVNRADGGIGRKLTLDVLKTQFGKGLKEAAENLGMCATTLKRACRRLGVKRWPRTPEAAVQVLEEAELTLWEMAARKNTHAPFGAPWESWPTAQGPGAAPGNLRMMHASHDGAKVGHMAPYLAGGLMEENKGTGFDEFDDFLDMLEVGE